MSSEEIEEAKNLGKKLKEAKQGKPNNRTEYIANAVIKFISAKQDREIMYFKSKHISEQMDGILTAKEVGTALAWLADNPKNYCKLDVERWGGGSGQYTWRVSLDGSD